MSTTSERFVGRPFLAANRPSGRLDPLESGSAGSNACPTLVRALLLLATLLPLSAAPPKPRNEIIRVPVLMDSRTEGTALKAGDFTVRLEGEPAKIVSVQGPEDDLMVLLVLDWSDELDLVDVARPALIEAVRGLPKNTVLGLLRAQDGLHVLLDPAADRNPLVESIQSQPVTGKPGLLDTLEPMARICSAVLAKASVRVAVVYITDSNIYSYQADYINPVINSSDAHDLSRRFPEGLVRDKISKLERQLAGLAAPLFVVHLAYRTDRVNEAYQSGLMQLAAASGGMSVFCRSRAEIPDAIANAFRTVAAHYSLLVQAPPKRNRIVPVQLESGGRALSYRSRFILEEK